MKHFLPDLIVEWPPRVVAHFNAMISPQYGRITSPFGDRAPDGRSGHHDFDGWLIARGPDIEAASSIEGMHELDLAPTVHAWFDLAIPPHFRGKPAKALLPRPEAIRPA